MRTRQPIPYNIIFDLIGVLFYWDPIKDMQTGTRTFTPIHENIALLEECARITNHEGTSLHRFFILSNCKLNLLEELYKAYPHTFEPFEGIVIPTHAGFAKPDKRMFEHLLAKYALHPAHSIFIDDAPENTKAAIELGITGITYGPGVNLQRSFISYGIIPYIHDA